MTDATRSLAEIDRLTREVDSLREETAMQAATIELLEAENERLHALLMGEVHPRRIDA